MKPLAENSPILLVASADPEQKRQVLNSGRQIKLQARLPLALIRLYQHGEWQGQSPLQLQGLAIAALTC